MRVRFLIADKGREHNLAEVLGSGVRNAGDRYSIDIQGAGTTIARDVDVVCMVGVKSRKSFQAYRSAGVDIVYFDKGYVRERIPDADARRWSYWRVAVNAHQPTAYLDRMNCSPKRFEELLSAGLAQIEPKWRESGEQIVYAGSSAKYHSFFGLPEPTKYAKMLVKRLRRLTQRQIVYRPKPSWHEAVPIAGTTYSQHPQRIAGALKGAHALVTHGSNACWEAVLSGIPCVILGDAPAKVMSTVNLEEIEDPFIASEEARRQWLANLAWCQWLDEELQDGSAWAAIRERIIEEREHG